MKRDTIKAVIVFMIITIIFIWIVAPKFFGQTICTKWDAARPKMAVLETAIDTYQNNTRNLPRRLKDLLSCPAGLEDSWAGPYLNKQSQLYDPWDRPFIYVPSVSDPNNYRLISFGADGKVGGDGYNKDIYNY